MRSDRLTQPANRPSLSSWEEVQPSNVTAIVALINPPPPLSSDWSVHTRTWHLRSKQPEPSNSQVWMGSVSSPCASRQRTSPCPPSRCQRCPLPSHCWPFYPCAVLSEPDTPRLTVTREEKDIDVDARPPKLNGISHFGCTDVTLSRHEQESWANLDTEVGRRGAFAWPTGLG